MAFVNSPLLHAGARGTVWHGLMHACDWFATLLSAAGLRLPANTTATDSVNVWAGLSAGGSSPRAVLVHHSVLKHQKPLGKIRAGGYNLYVGDPGAASGWPRPGQPEPDFLGNCTAKPCLFRVAASPWVGGANSVPAPVDVSEHRDIADELPELVRNMTAMLLAAACGDCAQDTLPNTTTQTVCDGLKWGALSPYTDLGLEIG